jgi:hypothetical protein
MYHFSDNLPRCQARLEDQLSRITWRDIIFLFRDTVSLWILTIKFAFRSDNFSMNFYASACRTKLQEKPHAEFFA